MLSSTFDPFLFSLPLTSAVGQFHNNHLILTDSTYEPMLVFAEESPENPSSSGITTSENTLAPRGLSLPPWTPSPAEDITRCESDVRHMAELEETDAQTEVNEEAEHDSPGEVRSNTEPKDDDDLKSDCPSVVSSIPYADEDDSMGPAPDEPHNQIITPHEPNALLSTETESDEGNDKAKAHSEQGLSIPSSQHHPPTMTLIRRNDPSSTAMPPLLQPRPRVLAPRPQPSTPPTNPSSPLIKIEPTSAIPTPSPSTLTLEAELATLITQLHKTRTLLGSSNTHLETISNPLPGLFTRITTLQSTRKSLLARRKYLDHRIASNRAEIKSSQEQAKKMHAEQIGVMAQRDRMQVELDGLVVRRREVKRVVAESRYERELEGRWEDKGLREVARAMGWKGAASVVSDDSDEEEERAEGEEGGWVRVANALIEGDESVDFQDLMVVREMLGDVDRRVKLEADVKVGPGMDDLADATDPATALPPRSAASQAVKIEPTETHGVALLTSPTTLAGRVRAESESGGSDGGKDSDGATGEITLEKLQEEFEAMDRHKRKMARMLRTLKGTGAQRQRGKKRKNAPAADEGFERLEADMELARKRRRSIRFSSASDS